MAFGEMKVGISAGDLGCRAGARRSREESVFLSRKVRAGRENFFGLGPLMDANERERFLPRL